MTYEEAIKILEVNVICSPKATQFREAVEMVKAEIEKKDIEIDILIRKKETLNDEISELKAEIERLKKEAYYFCLGEIDDLLKEMANK